MCFQNTTSTRFTLLVYPADPTFSTVVCINVSRSSGAVGGWRHIVLDTHGFLGHRPAAEAGQLRGSHKATPLAAENQGSRERYWRHHGAWVPLSLHISIPMYNNSCFQTSNNHCSKTHELTCSETILAFFIRIVIIVYSIMFAIFTWYIE